MDKLRNLVRLELGANAMTGEVPPSVSELVNLTYLALYNNWWSGKLLEKPFLLNMTGLEILLLDDNAFSGTISSDIRLLSNLVALDMGNIYTGRFTGTIPTELGLLTNLLHLSLTRNRFTGTIPTEIARLHLYHLALNHNELTGTFPTELALLTDIGM